MKSKTPLKLGLLILCLAAPVFWLIKECSLCDSEERQVVRWRNHKISFEEGSCGATTSFSDRIVVDKQTIFYSYGCPCPNQIWVARDTLWVFVGANNESCFLSFDLNRLEAFVKEPIVYDGKLRSSNKFYTEPGCVMRP